MFLSDISATLRGKALYAFSTLPRGSSVEVEAERIASALQLDPETSHEDFIICAQVRDRALQRVLDPEGVKLLSDLAKAWKCPRELILMHALKSFSLTKPDLSTFDSEI